MAAGGEAVGIVRAAWRLLRMKSQNFPTVESLNE